MRTIKTGPVFWVECNTLIGSYIIECELDHDTTCIVRSFKDAKDARDLVARLNVAAYRWAISEND